MKLKIVTVLFTVAAMLALPGAASAQMGRSSKNPKYGPYGSTMAHQRTVHRHKMHTRAMRRH